MNMTLQRRVNCLLGIFFLGCGILYNFPPQEYHFYPLCPFFALTHLLCPGCGGTRALYQLLHLHFSEALRLNALVTVSLPIVLVWFFYWYYSVIRYQRSPQIRLSRPVVVCLYLVVVFFVVARNTGIAFAI